MLDPHPILLPGQFRLWEWIASYYLCTPGDVYKAALPSGMKLESETIVTLNTDYEADIPLSVREQQVLDQLTADPEQCITSWRNTPNRGATSFRWSTACLPKVPYTSRRS